MKLLATSDHELVVESLHTILAEVEDNEDISQGAVDQLHLALQILGAENAKDTETDRGYTGDGTADNW